MLLPHELIHFTHITYLALTLTSILCALQNIIQYTTQPRTYLFKERKQYWLEAVADTNLGGGGADKFLKPTPILLKAVLSKYFYMAFLFFIRSKEDGSRVKASPQIKIQPLPNENPKTQQLKIPSDFTSNVSKYHSLIT